MFPISFIGEPFFLIGSKPQLQQNHVSYTFTAELSAKHCASVSCGICNRSLRVSPAGTYIVLDGDEY